MNLRRLVQIVLILLVAVLVAACGGGGSSSSSSSSSSSATVTLTQTITTEADSDGNVVTLGYPAGWVASSEFGGITLGNSQAVMDLMNAGDDTVRPAAGQIGGNVSVVPTADLSFLGVQEGGSPADVVTAFMGFFTGEGDTANMSTPEAVTLNGKTAAISTGTITDETGPLDAALVAVAVDNGYAVFLFAAAEGQIAQFNNAIRAIAGSVTYGPAG